MLINKSSRQLSQLFRVVLFVISIAFAFFLLQAGSLIIKNLPKVGVDISLNDYLDEKEVNLIDEKLNELNNDLEILNIEKSSLIALHDGVDKDYQLEKERYQSELAARYVTEDNAENESIKTARRELESKRQNLQSLKSDISRQAVKITSKNNEIATVNFKRDGIYYKARKEKTSQEDINTLKAFSLRLFFVLPLLVFAFFLYVKYKNSNYWPFVYGWGYFSIYAFFIELVPYFPSYGGYARAAVGITLCFVVGKYTIQKRNCLKTAAKPARQYTRCFLNQITKPRKYPDTC